MIKLRPTYSSREFELLIARESDSVELKTGAGSKPIQEAMVAFSNTEGGVIFIGVDDGRRVLGRRLDQSTDDRIHEAASAAHDIGRYEIQEIAVAGHQVVAVTVHRREQGFSQTSDGRLLVRRGARKHALIGHEAWEFMSARALRRFEQMSSGVPRHATDQRAMNALFEVFGWDPDDVAIDTRLRERGLLTADGDLTIAGALVLTDPSSMLGAGKFVVEIRRYDDDESLNYDRREVFGRDLPEQVRAAAQFVSDELGTDVLVTGIYRHELPRLPVRVVREAIANAVAHRSYELDRATILVELRPSRVVVTSPGQLPEPVTVATMRQAQAARNPVVIDVLRRFRLAEDAGQGVDVMEDQMRDAMLDPPRFEETADSVRVVLGLLGPVAPRERAWLTELERRGRLQPVDRLLLVHAARGETLTNAAARTLTGLGQVEARRALHRLRDQKLLIQHGERGGASYTLGEGLAPAAAFRMSPRQLEDMVLAEAGRRPIRNADIREMTGLGRADVRSLLARLVSSGQLVQVGMKRGTSYRRARSV